MTKDEALKIALQALKTIDEAMPFPVAKLAQKAIKEALAQPEGCQCPACKVKSHASDCSVHSEPAYPKGACNCGAQPEQEPVAWIDEFGNVFPLGAQRGPKYLNEPMKPLYTSPPASKPWVGLTDREIDDLYCEHHDEYGCQLSVTGYERAIEAKLKEKNT